MKRRNVALHLWFLMLFIGCANRRGTALTDGSAANNKVWSFEDAKQVLEAAATSDNPTLRAMSIPALAQGTPGDVWVKRGWYDPSGTVQRATAKQHAHRIERADLDRPGADNLARALAMLHAGIEPVSAEELSRMAVQDVLLPALLGHPASISTLLVDVRDGMVPPESMFIEVLVHSEIPEIGNAMAEGSLQAEEEMRLPLALAALQVSPEAGHRSLVGVLRDADEVTKIFAVEALTEQGSDGAVTWLKRASKGEPGAVRQHARIGLVALGMAPIDEAVAALDSPDRDLRAWAAMCLGSLAENRSLPRSVIAALENSWRDESMLVRLAATEALIAGSKVGAIPLSPAQAKADLDAVAVMVALEWFSIHAAKLPAKE